MNPIVVYGESFRRFDKFRFEIPTGCTALVGRNGAGKSTIVNAIEVALFGPATGTLADLLTRGGQSTELVVALEFEHAGRIYRARRWYSARGAGKTGLDLEAFTGNSYPDDDRWEPLTEETQKQTQQKLCDLIRLTRTTFRASVFIAQRAAASFTGADPRERKQVVQDILDLGRFAEAHKLVSADIVVTTADLGRAQAEAARCQDEVTVKDATVTERARLAGRDAELVARIATTDEEFTEVALRYRQAREARQALTAAQVTVDHARERLARLAETSNAALKASELLDEARKELGPVELLAAQRAQLVAARDEIKGALAEHERRRAEADRRQRLIAQADTLLARAEHVLGNVGDARCDKCEQTLGLEAAAVAAANDKREAERLRTEAATLADYSTAIPPSPAALTAAEHAVDAAFAATTRAAQLAERIQHLRDQISAANSPEFATALQQAERAAQDAADTLGELTRTSPAESELDKLEREGVQLRHTTSQLRDELSQVREQLGRCAERLDRITAHEDQLANLAVAISALIDRLDALKVLALMFGKDGIAALIVEAVAIPQIQAEANRVLEELGSTYHVQLRTQRLNKSNDNIRETLDLVFADTEGEGTYETLSGGEQMRADIAIHVAISRLIAHRRGTATKLLVLDEPDALDEEGMALLSSLLPLLTDFARVIVVSHNHALADALDQVVHIERDANGRSRIVPTGVLVAA